MKGWSCSRQHGPAHFTLLKHLFVWIAWNFSKTVKFIAWPCRPKHGPVLFSVLKNLLHLKLCSRLKLFMFMAGSRSPTSFVTAQFFSRLQRNFLTWCCADNQQRSNERFVVLPQTRSSSFQVFKHLFVWMTWSFLKTFKVYGWAVLPQTRPSSFNGVKKPFRLWVKQPIKNI